MLLKLVIIAGIVIFGVTFFASDIQTLLPNTSSITVDSLKTDVADLTVQAADSVEQRFDTTVDTIKDTTDSVITTHLNDAESLITDGITNVTDSTQSAINDRLSDFKPLEPLTNILNNSSGP